MSLLPLFLIFSSAFLHAGWNLLVRRHRTTEIFLPMTALISVLGLGPALAAELRGTPTPWVVWLHLPAAGLFQACYYLGLSRGYRKGDFTVVYPLARALPVLLLAVADVLLGQPPSIVGWLGMLLVTAGCLVVPLESLRDFSRARYWNGATRWAIFTALATVGYTVVDNHAAEFLPTSPLTAARYGLFETVFSFLIFWPLSRIGRGQGSRGAGEQGGRGAGEQGGWGAGGRWQVAGGKLSLITHYSSLITHHWKWPLIAGLFMFGGYWLILWAYQLTEHTSYVIALRQFSIVIGVVSASFLFREPAPLLHTSAALIIVAGIASIALAG